MTARSHQATGWHLLADLSGMATTALWQMNQLETLLLESAQAAGARVLSCHFHAFETGQGVTGVALLAESHISIHTWPEEGFAAVDIFMCGGSDPTRALQVIQTALKPTTSSVRLLRRGGGKISLLESTNSRGLSQ